MELTLFNVVCGVFAFGILAVLISLLAPVIAPYAFGVLPYLLILGAATATGFLFLLSRLTLEDASEIIVAMVTIWLAVMLVLVFVSQFCLNIRPMELFEDAGISALETEVCTVLKNIEEYVKGKYGQKAIDNPSLVTKSMYLTGNDCKPGSGSVDDRIQAMERALGLLLEQPLQQATIALECDPPEVQNPRIQKGRLDRIKKQLEFYKKTYLEPLGAVQDRLKKGDLTAINPKCQELAKKTAVNL